MHRPRPGPSRSSRRGGRSELAFAPVLELPDQCRHAGPRIEPPRFDFRNRDRVHADLERSTDGSVDHRKLPDASRVATKRYRPTRERWWARGPSPESNRRGSASARTGLDQRAAVLHLLPRLVERIVPRHQGKLTGCGRAATSARPSGGRRCGRTLRRRGSSKAAAGRRQLTEWPVSCGLKETGWSS